MQVVTVIFFQCLLNLTMQCFYLISENYNVVTKLSITTTTGTTFTLTFDQPINKGLKNFTLGYELHFTDNKNLNKWDHKYVPLSSILKQNGDNENGIIQNGVSETTESPDAYSLDDIIYVKVQELKENTTYYIKVRILVEWEDVKKLLVGSGTREERSADDRAQETIALEEMEDAPLTIIPYSNTISITTLLSGKN